MPPTAQELAEVRIYMRPDAVAQADSSGLFASLPLAEIWRLEAADPRRVAAHILEILCADAKLSAEKSAADSHKNRRIQVGPISIERFDKGDGASSLAAAQAGLWCERAAALRAQVQGMLGRGNPPAMIINWGVVDD